MAFLKPDKTRTEYGLVIKEKIIPFGTKWTRDWNGWKVGDLYKADRKLSDGTGKVQYVTIHNTNDIKEDVGTNDAEQYARATWQQNMGDARVHYFIDETDCWQLLREDEVGWHAGDGRGAGNETTLSIEIIMDGSGSAADKAAEERGAKLAAILLKRHGLSIDKLTTHQRWSGKYCPAYILPHWSTFKTKVEKYLAEFNKPATPVAPKFNGKINGYNVQRKANYLVIYNKGSNTNTNKWGTEVSVDSNGIATCTPVYGKGNMSIPSGGYVISGHGDASKWILEKIKKGSKITISNETVKVGAVVTAPKFNGKINGYNIQRKADYLVIYDKGKSTNTNKWGTEVAVGSNGVAICSPVYGKGNMEIPNNGYVISGHGNASAWVLEKIKKGSKITISDGVVKVGAVVSTSATKPATNTIKVGSKVKLRSGAKTYTGGNLASFVYGRTHTVKEISGDKAVITFCGIVVAAVKLSDLTLV